MKLLETQNMTMQFGGLKAVDSLTFHINEGELMGLIGPNGAGKTTCFNMLTGVYKPTSGDVLFGGQSILGKKPFEISHLGVTRTFQNIRLFRDLTVLENVLIAGSQHQKYGMGSAVLQTDQFLKEEKDLVDKAMKLLSISIRKRTRNLPRFLTVSSENLRSFAPWPPIQS
jgi:branched-chain amino acid transport system ATP-binding protein